MAGRRYDFPSPWWDTASQSGKDLIGRFLTKDPKKRITAKEAMVHTFMKEAGGASLAEAMKQLKKFNANQRLRKAALGVIAQRRLEKALDELRLGAK